MKKRDSMKKRNDLGRQGCHRQSIEIASSANGWLKAGYVRRTGESNFFTQVYCINQ